MTPLFVFGSTFDTAIPIGDKTLPFHVKRLSRAEFEAFTVDYDRLSVIPRGSRVLGLHAEAPDDQTLAELRAEAERIDAWTKETQDERDLFYERVIRAYITIDAGIVSVCGRDVTDGAGLHEAFLARKDVHYALVLAILKENRLDPIFAKNSSSPRASDGGSEASSPARGGDEPGSTAANAAPSAIAASENAMDVPTNAPAGSPSGEIRKIH